MSEVITAVQKRLAVDVVSQPRMIELMQAVAMYKVQTVGVKVTDGMSEQKAVDSMVVMHTTSKALETLRKECVAFPNLYKQAIQDTFGRLQDTLGKARNSVALPLQAYRDDQAAVAAKQQAAWEAEQAKLDESPAIVEPSAPAQVESVVVAQPEAPAPAEPVSHGTDGGGVYERTSYRANVINKLELLKAIISKSSRWDHVTLDLIEVNQGTLDRLVAENRKRVPGVEKVETRTMVARSK